MANNEALKPFDGFDPKALGLLKQMPKWDEKEYARHKEQLTGGLREPGWRLIQQLAAALDAPLTVDKRASVSPLHRDLRFAKAGTPRYKDHLIMTAWQGADKKTAATLWLRIDAESIGFASGLAFTPAQRDTFRKVVGGASGEGLAKELRLLEKKHKAHSYDLAGVTLKKVPAPFSADHPRAELLRMTGFQVRFHEPHPSSVAGPGISPWCKKRLDDLLGVHHFLAQEIQ